MRENISEPDDRCILNATAELESFQSNESFCIDPFYSNSGTKKVRRKLVDSWRCCSINQNDTIHLGD